MLTDSHAKFNLLQKSVATNTGIGADETDATDATCDVRPDGRWSLAPAVPAAEPVCADNMEGECERGSRGWACGH
eukprot:713765-Pelagomonas_calceolata.AAC.1